MTYEVWSFVARFNEKLDRCIVVADLTAGKMSHELQQAIQYELGMNLPRLNCESVEVTSKKVILVTRPTVDEEAAKKIIPSMLNVMMIAVNHLSREDVDLYEDDSSVSLAVYSDSTR